MTASLSLSGARKALQVLVPLLFLTSMLVGGLVHAAEQGAPGASATPAAPPGRRS